MVAAAAAGSPTLKPLAVMWVESTADAGSAPALKAGPRESLKAWRAIPAMCARMAVSTATGCDHSCPNGPLIA
jgi:hypothetical protein